MPKSPNTSTPKTPDEPKGDRLQKILAQAGIASRRKAEEIILEGRVQVNGTTITELGTRADATTDHIRVDGKLLKGPEQQRYYMLNKPRGYVTTLTDPQKRPNRDGPDDAKVRATRGPGAPLSGGAARLPLGRVAADDERRRAGQFSVEGGGGS